MNTFLIKLTALGAVMLFAMIGTSSAETASGGSDTTGLGARLEPQIEEALNTRLV